MPEEPKQGDEVKTGQTYRGKVEKVKPDGTRVIRTKTGNLKKEKHPEKPVDPRSV